MAFSRDMLSRETTLPAQGGTRMKKRLLSLLFMLALCLGLLPATALAAGEIKLFIGGQQITESGCYENQNGTWTKVDGTEPANGQFSYDAATFTLTLNGAEITNNQTVNVAEGYTYDGSVIAFSQTADVSLKIVVSQGTSTITGTGGIRVESTTGDVSLSIAGPGSLDVEPKGSNSGITLCSSKNMNLDIDGADVTASSPAQYGVYLISSTDASSTSTITVNNGSLTTGGNGYVGIYYYWSDTNNAGTSSLTVSGNAVVDTRNSRIMTSNSGTGVQVGAGSDGNGGIVFKGKSGTVYGDVTVDENLTIGKDETLTIGKDASLTVPSDKTLTNNGTVTTTDGGTLTGTITNPPPKITTASLPNGEVDKKYSQSLAADNKPTSWSITGSLPAGLTLDESTRVISGTPTTAGESKFTVTATNASGSDSKEFTITVNYQPTAITTPPQSVAVTEGQTATFTVIATGNDLTYQWQYSMDKGQNWMLIGGATSDNSYTTAATTVNVTGTQYRCVVKGADGREVTSDAATLTVNPVTVTGVTLDKTTMDLVAGNSATLKATVAPENATNKTVTWASSNTAIATVDTTGKVTAVAPGTAIITATAADGSGKTATCKVTVTAKTYSLSIDPGAIGFGTAAVGYTQPAVREVTVKNTGNQTLTLTHPTAVNFEVGKLNQLTLAPGEKAVFTVRPKAGLSAGSYSETVVVKANSGTQVSVNLNFTVQNGTTATPVTESRTLHFNTMGGLPMDDVKFGLGAPVELWPYTPVRTGYLFQGWYADEALTQPVSTIVLVKDTTIYAKWAVNPAAQTASGSGSGSSGSGSGGSGSGSKATPTPSPSPTPEPTATPTPTPGPTATPEPTPEVAPAPEETDKGGFPILPVAAGVVVLAALAGGIVWFRRR